MPHHHAQHAQNVEPNLFVCNENHAYIMPCVTAHAVMSCMHHAVHASLQESQLPLCRCGMPEINYGHAIHASWMIFTKK